jgi:hypothetical protein
MKSTRTLNPVRSWARKPVMWVALGLMLALSACAPLAAQIVAAPLPDDGPPPAVSRAAALSLIQKTLTAGRRTTSDRALTLVLTDAEVTSFLNLRADLTRELEGIGLDQLGRVDELQGLVSEEIDLDAWRSLLTPESEGRARALPSLRLGLREVNVLFRDNGQIIARGEVGFLMWRRPVRLVVAPYAADGEISFEFVEGQVGTRRVPQLLFDLLGRGMTSALLLGQSFGYAEITQIQVTAGTLTLSGRLIR